MFTYPTNQNSIESSPDAVQVLLDSHRPAYYDDSEWSGKDHLLKDYSRNGGSIREKRQGHCLKFNGVDQYIDTGIILDPSTSDATYSVWFSLDDLSSDKVIVSCQAGRGAKNIPVLFYDQSAGALVSNIGNAPTTVLTNIEADKWYHAVVTWKYVVVSQCKIYINGDLDVTENGQTAVLADGNIIIGAIDSTPSSPFEGSLFDVRIYNDVLTADEVAYLYTFGQSGTDPGIDNLVVHYWMQEEAGSTVYDSSGNGDHAAITGYVASMRSVDGGVSYSVANEVGYSDWFDLPAGNAWIEVPPQNAGENCTFSLFVKTTANFGRLVGNYDIANYPGIAIVDSGNGIEVAEQNLPTRTVTLPYPINDDEVHHVAVAFGPAGEADVYYDGQFLETVTGLNGGFTWNAVGRRLATNYYIGKIADLQFFNRVLNASEVSTLYAGGTVEGNIVNYDDWTLQNTAVRLKAPPATGSTTQDALGVTLTYQGRAPMPGLAKHVAWQGNGSDVYVDLGEPAIPATDDFELSFLYYHTENNTVRQTCFSQRLGAEAGRIAITANSLGVIGTAGAITLFVAGFPGDDTISISNALVENSWHAITLIRESNDWYLRCVQPNGTVKQVTINESVSVAQVNVSLLAYVTSLFSSGAVGPVSITTGGVTTTYVHIKGTRNVAKLTSDGSDTKIIYDAVVGGTLSTLYSDGNGSWRLPHIENGGRWAEQNLIKRSEDFSTWTFTRMSLAATGLEDPFGGNGAARLLDGNTVNDFSRAYSAYLSLSAGEVLCFSVYLKAGEYTWVRLDATTGASVYFDILNGVSGASSGSLLAYGIEDVGNGWYRCHLSYVQDTTGIYERFAIYLATSNGSIYFPQSASKGIFVFGAQLNEGSTPLSYNKTGFSPWSASALIPADTLGNSPDGNALNIPKFQHPKSVLLDRTGGIISPLDSEVGTDQLVYEEYRDPVYHITTTPFEAIRSRTLELIYSRDNNYIEARA
jgi:hypothetical protein